MNSEGEKIFKQIVINITLIFVSVLVVFAAKTFEADKILSVKAYLGSDIMFILITSLFTTLGWRFVEHITGNWIYNIVVIVILFYFTFEYGVSIIKRDGFIIDSISISIFVFIAFYIAENIIIVNHFNRQKKSGDNISYRDED